MLEWLGGAVCTALGDVGSLVNPRLVVTAWVAPFGAGWWSLPPHLPRECAGVVELAASWWPFPRPVGQQQNK